MNIDNLIIIKNGTYTEVKKALQEWINLYDENLTEGLTFQLFNNGQGNFLIQADKDLDNERFYFLVNYLHFPIGIDYEIGLEGFTIGKDNDILKGKNLQVYISATDTDYDNVFVTTSENQNYKVDFGGKISQVQERKTYSPPTHLEFGISESLSIQKKEKFRLKRETDIEKLEKRFTIISAITIFIFGFAYVFFQNDKSFLKINSFISTGVFVWLLHDYKLLQVTKLYFKALAIGLAIFGYTYLLQHLSEDKNLEPTFMFASKMPILLLIVQRPLRFTFKQIMKREPVVDNPAPSVADLVYILILWMASIVVPAIYYFG